MKSFDKMTHIFIWLSGASAENLQDCPSWERRKYVAFGATVLVPCVFAFIAAAYAVSTLTDQIWISAVVAIAWAFIILTVDRALLATYRAYQSFSRKASQLALRVVVAVLMGLTISHPLTLLLFKDTISSVIEKDRDADIDAVQANATKQKKLAEDKIAAIDAEIADARKKWDDTFTAKFLNGEDANGKKIDPNEPPNKEKTALEKKIAEAQAPTLEKIKTIEKEIADAEAQSKTLQGELNYWQTEFEREVNGQRSGIVGLGPRATSIQKDQLTWRRDESKRLTTLLDVRSSERNVLRAEATTIEQGLTAEAEVKATELAMKERKEEERRTGLRRQVEQQQADQFVTQQNQIRATLKSQVDSRLEQASVFQKELARLGEDEATRVATLRAEPRRDILKQTLALHRIFREGSEGGTFALTAYMVLTLLFMMVDTIPVMVKFFSKPGPYDTIVDCDEVRFDRERESFLKSFHRYMDELTSGRLLHSTRKKPLELALMEGVDRTRAAKEFLEHLMSLEKAFEENAQLARSAIAESGESTKSRAEFQKELAESFYANLRTRMENFFKEPDPKRLTS